MKVILVNMPWKEKGIWGVRAGSRWPHIKDPKSEKDYLPYPFFLGYATSLLRKYGIEAELIDAIAEQIEIPDFIALLTKERPDLIVAETSTPSLQHDLMLLRKLRDIAPIAICGPEYHIRELSFLEDKSYIDYVMIGEYEETLLELVQKLQRKEDLSEVKGLIYRKGGKLYKNPLRGLIKDLDTLPWPCRDGLPMENYVDAPGGMPLPCAQMWSSRGCPYRCIFCLWPHIMYHGNTYRHRNPIKVVDEMEYLIKELGFKSIYIDDDTTNVSKRFLMEVASELKKRRLRFPWAIMARPDLMDKELLDALRGAGLYAVKYGVESAEQRLIDNAQKNMDLKYAIEMIKYTQRLGIKTHLTFTFGLPGETKQTIEKTIKLALELNPYSVQFSITTPFPGTTYFHMLKGEGWEEPDDWSLYDGHKAAVIQVGNLSAEDLEDALREAYDSWYRHQKEAFVQTPLSRRIKTFWDCARLYGIRFAISKTQDYLQVRREAKRNLSLSAPMRGGGPDQSIYDELKIIKGILSGRTAYSGPKSVTLDITDKCNISCIGCWLHSPYVEKRTIKNELSWGKVEKLINELSTMGVREVQISGGGEPLLHPNWLGVIKLVKEKGMYCNLVTNFTLFDKGKIDNILELGLDAVTISLWAGDEDTYIRTHPNVAPELFRKIKGNIKYLIQQREKYGGGPLVKIYNVICKENYLNIEKMLDFALEVGADYLEFQLMDPIPGKTEHLLIGKEEAEEIKSIFSKLKNRRDYITEFISDADLLIYKDKRHIEELFDFGSFVKKQDSNFVLMNGVRLAKCPRGHYSVKRELLPSKNVRKIRFYFDLNKCKRCELYKDCYKDGKSYPFEISLLTILGAGTFLRRVNSVAENKRYLDGSFVDSLPCYVGWHFARITTDGEVKPCCKAEGFSLGNIEERRFYEIWFSPIYDEFRHKAKCLSKSDPYFSNIQCYKVCDNLGMNLMVHGELLRHLTKGEVSKGPIYQKDKIIIPAKSFKVGNLNIKGNEFGPDIVIDNGFGFGYAEYEFKVDKDDTYELWSRYAAEIPRPVEIKIDGISYGKIMRHSTGGWRQRNLKYFKELEVHLESGRHKIEIFCPSYIPHLERLELRRKKKSPAKGAYCDPSVVYERRSPLLLVKESLKTHGVTFTTRRILNYLKPRNFVKNYLDIIGIYDGSYAYKGPFHVQIDLTNNCNNNCIGCWCNSPLLEERKMPPEVKAQYLPFELVEELLKELKALGTQEIYYSGGGEPFTHPDIMEILRLTKKLGFTCYVNTNFTLLDKEKIDQLIRIGVDHLTVSIWAGTARTYDITHPNKSEETFYQIQENLSYLNRKKLGKPYIKLYEVIFNLNYHEIKEMIEFAFKTACESVEFTLIDTIPGKTDKLALNAFQRRELYQVCKEIEKELSPDFRYRSVHLFRFDQFMRRLKDEEDVVAAKYDRNIIDSLPCYIGWLFARVLPDGNVNSCLKSHRFPVGNIFEQTFSEIWNSPRQVYFRQKTLCYKKGDPFFRLIGNDPQTKEAGCYKSCDDIGRNLHMHKKIMSLTPLENVTLKTIAKVKGKKVRRKKTPPILYTKTLPKLDDKVILGILDGRKAYQGPEHVVIDLTNKCQLRCIACWLYSPHLKEHKPCPEWLRQELPVERAKELIKELIQMGAKIIRFTGGGEPLLHPAVIELLEIVKSKGVKACLTTNLYNVKEDTLKHLAKLTDEIAISLWAGDANTYVKMHPGTSESDFHKIEEDIKFLSSNKLPNSRITLANVITKLNYKEIFEMAEFAERVKADAVYYTMVDVFENETDFLLLDETEYNELEKEFKKVENYLKGAGIEIENLEGFKERIENRTSTGHYDKNRIDRVPCYIGWFFARILADGTVVPCCRGVSYPMGNVNKSSFSDIWYSRKYSGFRARAKTLKKDHPYFWKMGCYRECDNFMHNEEMHKRLLATCPYEGSS